MTMTRPLHREYGLFVGTSSGANVIAALQLARELGPRSPVVTLLCDRAERYFSTLLFDAPKTPPSQRPKQESPRANRSFAVCSAVKA